MNEGPRLTASFRWRVYREYSDDGGPSGGLEKSARLVEKAIDFLEYGISYLTRHDEPLIERRCRRLVYGMNGRHEMRLRWNHGLVKIE
jgi:hypothetical protein